MSVACPGRSLRARICTLSLTVAFVLSSVTAARSVTETGQGTLMIPGHKAIGIVSFEHEAVGQVDIATGTASGRRRHDPIVITREVGASSPALLEGLSEGVVVPLVRIDFTGAKHYRVTLTNAVVTHTRFVGRPASGAGERLASMTLRYEKIEWAWTEGGVSRHASWRFHEQDPCESLAGLDDGERRLVRIIDLLANEVAGYARYHMDQATRSMTSALGADVKASR